MSFTYSLFTFLEIKTALAAFKFLARQLLIRTFGLWTLCTLCIYEALKNFFYRARLRNTKSASCKKGAFDPLIVFIGALVLGAILLGIALLVMQHAAAETYPRVREIEEEAGKYE